MKPKIGAIDVGGGFRGGYASGVLDYCMEMTTWMPKRLPLSFWADAC